MTDRTSGDCPEAPRQASSVHEAPEEGRKWAATNGDTGERAQAGGIQARATEARPETTVPPQAHSAGAGGKAAAPAPGRAPVPPARPAGARPGAVLLPMDRRLRLLTLCLGMVACIGPLAIDMYLPAMPAMAADLGAAEGEIELSFMGFFLGFCFGQLFFGPLSDRIGRKPVIFIGMGLFAFASIGCILSGSAQQLALWRTLQGVGGSIGMVITISSVRDLFSGAQAARMMGFVISIFGIAPIVAPLLGGLIVQTMPWQMIFVFLAAFALAVIALVALVMPETRSPEMRAASRPSEALSHYVRLLGDRHFIPFAAASAFATGGLFAYVAGAPFILMEIYGLTPMQFSLLFGVNAMGMVIFSQMSGRIIARVGPARAGQGAMAVRAVAGILILLLYMAGTLPLALLGLLLFFYLGTHGIIMPASNILALDRQQAIGGTAAALIGALGFGGGAVASAVISAMADGTALPTLIILAAMASVATLIALAFFGRGTSD